MKYYRAFNAYQSRHFFLHRYFMEEHRVGELYETMGVTNQIFLSDKFLAM